MRLVRSDQKPKDPSCLECGDFGYISADRDGYTYAFACVDCVRGMNQPATIERWTIKTMSKGFQRLPMWWDSLKQAKGIV